MRKKEGPAQRPQESHCLGLTRGDGAYKEARQDPMWRWVERTRGQRGLSLHL